MKDEDMHAYCLEWCVWSRTRKFVGPAQGVTIPLARFLPSKVGQEPDGPMRADMVLFDLAVRALPDTLDKLALVAFYGQRRTPIKVLAHHMGISRNTFYNAMKRGRSEAFNLAKRINTANVQF